MLGGMLASGVGVFLTLFSTVKAIKEDTLKDSDNLEVAFSGGSLVKLTNGFILEPVIIIDDALEGSDDIGDIIDFNVRVFSAYYLQAIPYMINMLGMEPKVVFELLSSRGHNLGELAATLVAGGEAASIIPDFEEMEKEAYKIAAEAKHTAASRGIKISNDSKFDSAHSRVLEVTIDVEDKTIEQTIYVKPNIIYSSYDHIEELYKAEGKDSSIGAAIHALFAGTRSLADVITGSSLVEAYEKRLISNENELLVLLNDRRNKAYSKINKGGVGYNLYYAMTIVPITRKPMINAGIYGDIKNESDVGKLFESSKSMILTLVDTGYESVELYIKDGVCGTTVGFDNMLPKNKGDNGDLLKSIIANKSLL